MASQNNEVTLPLKVITDGEGKVRVLAGEFERLQRELLKTAEASDIPGLTEQAAQYGEIGARLRQVADEQAGIREITATLREMGAAGQLSQAQVEGLAADLDKIGSNRAAIVQLQALEAQVTNAEAALARQRTTLNQSALALDDAKARAGQYTQAVATARAEVDRSKAVHEGFKAELAQLRVQQDSSSKQTAEQQQQIQGLNLKVKLAKEQLDGARGALKEVEKAQRAANVEAATLSGQFERQSQQVDRAQKAQAGYSQQLTTSRAALERMGVTANNVADIERELVQSQEALRQKMLQVAQVGQSRDLLGVRSHDEIQREIKETITAYNTLKASGTASHKELAQAALKTEERIRELERQTNGWKDSLANAKTELVSAAAGMAGFGLAAREAISFESAMANVGKVLDGTDAQLLQLGESIKAMSQELRVPPVELAKMAEAGGQLGVPMGQMEQFITLAAKMGTAFGVSAEEAGQAVGKLSVIFGLPLEGIEQLANGLNVLGNNTAATEKGLLDFLTRVGGSAQQFGLTAEQVSALGATFLSMGKTPEVAGTAVNALLQKLQTANVQGDGFKATLTGMGLSAEQLATSIRENPQAALEQFLGTLEHMQPQQRAEALAQLFGLEYADDIAALTGALGEYRKALGLVGDEQKKAGSLEAEFEKRLSTTESQLNALKTAVQTVAINFGSILLPAISATAEGMAEVTTAVAGFIKEHPNISATLGVLAGAATIFGTVRLAALAASVAFSGPIGLVKGLVSAATGLTSVAAASGVAAPALTRVGSAANVAGAKLGTVGAAASGASAKMGIVATASGAMADKIIGGAAAAAGKVAGLASAMQGLAAAVPRSAGWVGVAVAVGEVAYAYYQLRDAQQELQKVQQEAEASSRAVVARLDAELEQHKRFREQAILSAEQLADMSDEARDSYLRSLEGAAQYYNALSVAQRRAGLDTGEANARQQEYNEAIARLPILLDQVAEKQFAQANQAAIAWGQQQIAAGQLADALEQAAASGDKSAEAVGKLVGAEQLLKPDGIAAVAGAMQMLEASGSAAAQVIETQLAQSLQKLSNEQLAQLQQALSDAFAQGNLSAKEFADTNDRVLGAAFTRLGLSAEVELGKVTPAARSAAESLDLIRAGLERTSLTGEQRMQALGNAIAKAVGEVKTQADLDLIRAKIDAMGKSGELAGQQLTDAMKQIEVAAQRVATATGDVAGAFGRLGIQSKAELAAIADQMRNDVATAIRSGQASTEQLQQAMNKAYQAAIAAGNGSAKAWLELQAPVYGVKLKLDEVAGAAAAAGSAGAEAGNQLAAGMDKARASIEAASDAYGRASWRNADGSLKTDAAAATPTIPGRYPGTDENSTGFGRSAGGLNFVGIVNYLTGAGLDKDRAIAIAKKLVDGNGQVIYSNNPGQREYKGSTLTEALSNAVAQEMLASTGAGAGGGMKMPATKPTPAPTTASPAPATTPAPAATPAVATSHTVTINLGGRSTTVNTSSASDATALTSLLRDLEAAAMRSQ